MAFASYFLIYFCFSPSSDPTLNRSLNQISYHSTHFHACTNFTKSANLERSNFALVSAQLSWFKWKWCCYQVHGMKLFLAISGELERRQEMWLRLKESEIIERLLEKYFSGKYGGILCSLLHWFLMFEHAWTPQVVLIHLTIPRQRRDVSTGDAAFDYHKVETEVRDEWIRLSRRCVTHPSMGNCVPAFCSLPTGLFQRISHEVTLDAHHPYSK